MKTLHPKVFGGILYRREHLQDLGEIEQYEIEPIDLVIVDLYPFEKYVQMGATPEEIIEKSISEAFRLSEQLLKLSGCNHRLQQGGLRSAAPPAQDQAR